jgi:AcrR family transcriptional regulator
VVSTRDRFVADAAWSLIADRSFEQVTVAEIARRAEVSDGTVFNYFPTKEDLVFHGLEDFEAGMLDAIRQRPVGTAVLDAFITYVLDAGGSLASDAPEDAATMRSFARMVDASPSLRACEREIYDCHTLALAGVIAAEAGAQPDDRASWVVANAMVGLHRSLVDCVRTALRSGEDSTSIRTDVRRSGQEALEAMCKTFG